MENKQMLPHSIDAERAILGGIFRWPGAMSDVALIVDPDDFYAMPAAETFRIMLDLWTDGKPIDLVSVADRVKAADLIKDIPYDYLAMLWDAAATGANVFYHAEIVRGLSLRRHLYAATQELANQALHPSTSTPELIEAAEQRIFLIGERGVRGESVSLVKAMAMACDQIDLAATGKKKPSIPTGFLELDTLTGGLHSSELILLAARPSVGKTSLALAMMRNIITEGYPVLFCSIEQRAVEVAERLLCCEGLVNSHRVRTSNLDGRDFENIASARSKLSLGKMEIFEASYQSLTTIAAQVRRQKSRLGIRAVFIDYLQMIEPEDRRVPRHEQVGGISRRLKWLARETDLPIVALAQLNREIEHRSDTRPRLADLRDSGELEQNADTVMLLHQPKETPNVIEINVAKQRNGRKGELMLVVQPEYYRYGNFSVRHSFAGAT